MVVGGLLFWLDEMLIVVITFFPVWIQVQPMIA
jgi:hypothetical protein